MDNQLPAFVLAGLYKNSLVITGDINVQPPKQAVQVTENDAVATPENTQAAQKKWYLGDNKKGIVVVAADDTAVFINDEWLDTLGKMLTGLKVNFGDTAIVNLYNHPITFNGIKQQLNARHVIMFGVTPQQLGLPFTIPHYQVQNYAGCTFLTAPTTTLAGPANTTEAIKLEKRKLWDRLKSLEL